MGQQTSGTPPSGHQALRAMEKAPSGLIMGRALYSVQKRGTWFCEPFVPCRSISVLGNIPIAKGMSSGSDTTGCILPYITAFLCALQSHRSILYSSKNSSASWCHKFVPQPEMPHATRRSGADESPPSSCIWLGFYNLRPRALRFHSRLTYASSLQQWPNVNCPCD